MPKAGEERRDIKVAERENKGHQSLDPTLVLPCGWSRSGLNEENERK